MSALHIKPSELVAHTKELAKILNNELSEEWINTRGIDVEAVGLENILVHEDDAKLRECQ